MIKDTKVKQFCKDAGYDHVKKCGLGATVMAFYMGTKLEWGKNEDFDSIANELNLSKDECNYWEDLFYKKDSWLNKNED